MLDRKIERAVQLLEKSENTQLQPAESRELTSLTGFERHDIPPDLLHELRQAVAQAKELDAKIERASALLDKAETERLSPEERAELSALEPSMKDAVRSVLGRKTIWFEMLASGERQSPVGKALVDALQSRIVDRGSMLVGEILPRSRWLKCVDVPVLLRPVEQTLRETVWRENWVALSAMPDRVAREDGSVELALELLEKSKTVPLNTVERRELISMVGPNRQSVRAEDLNELRQVATSAQELKGRIERVEVLLAALESRSLAGARVNELSKLMDSNRQDEARVSAETIPLLQRMAADGSLAPEARVLAQTLGKQAKDQETTLHDLQSRASRQGVAMQRKSSERAVRLDVPARGNVVALRRAAPGAAGPFAQVARHPEADRVIVRDGRRIRAVPKKERPAGHDAGRLIGDFIEALQSRFGNCPLGLHYLKYIEKNGSSLTVGEVSDILSANQNPVGRPSAAKVAEPRSFRAILVGGGPRTSTQISAEIDRLLKPDIMRDIKEIQGLGGVYSLVTTIVEKRRENTIGMGEAWNEDQQGTVNTGAERGQEFDERLRTDYIERNSLYSSAAQHFPPALAAFRKAELEADEAGITKSELQSTVTSAPAKEEARPAQRPEATEQPDSAEPNRKERRVQVDRAFGLRYLLGQEEHKHFNARLDKANATDWLKKIYKVQIFPDTTVVAVDASPPLKASLTLTDKQGNTSSIEADMVRMNTGTTLASPLTAAQEDVGRNYSYIGPMSREKLKAVLKKRQLLGPDDRLKPGTSVLTGGSGLSLYDQLVVLDSLMGLTRMHPSSPTKWVIDEEAKQKYKGAILITSNTDGKWISPRHSHTPAWTQKLTPISNATEQHALFLHNQGEEIYKAWQDICIASIAAATGMTPKQARLEGMNTEELLSLQLAETRKHDQAAPEHRSRTLFGARREAFLGTVVGTGLERDFEQAAATLAIAAPLTYVSGYIMHRAQVNAITDPDAPISQNNRALIDVHNGRFQDITASPAIVHRLAKDLMDAGIARYTPGSYSAIEVAPNGSSPPLIFRDFAGNESRHDVFVVSPIFNLKANPAELSLTGQVAPLHADTPHIARVGPNRMFRGTDDTPLSVESFSNASKGTRASRESFIGVYAYDVNNRDSAVQVSSGLAHRRLAEMHLSAAGWLDPYGDVQKMYQDLYPNEEAYRAEVETFRGDFASATYKAALMRQAERLAGDDPNEFRRLYEIYAEAARDPNKLRDLGNQALAGESAEMPEFTPASREKYFGRFVDAPDHIHERVYRRAFQEAKSTLDAAQKQFAA